MIRKLTLKSEHLAELGGDDLASVVGAASGTTCLPRVSDLAISLCGCLTNYCSIDVC